MEHVEPQTMKLLGHGRAYDVKSSSVRFSKGDVLYGKMRPYLNKVWLAEFDGLCSAEFLVFPKTDELNNQLLAYRLNSQDFVNFANRQVSGERPRVDFEKLARFPILLPPLSEQDRIVAKLDALLSRVATGEAAARRAMDRLQGYRAAVLYAGVTGELTRDWRKSHAPEESGEQLLMRLLAERRARWEAAELKRLHARGKPSKNENWKSKYPNPVGHNDPGLPHLPSNWTWATLEMIAEIGSGLSVSQSRVVKNTVSVPYLRVANVLRGRLDLSEIKTIKVNRDQLQPLLLQPGDILFNEGGDRDKLGRGWIWEGQIPRCIHQNHVFRARLIDPSLVDPKLISHWGNTFGQQFFMRHGTQTTNLASINRSVLARLPIPLIPVAEQKAITKELDRRLSAADRLETTLFRQLDRAQVRRQSLLREAFSGTLVAQAPNDEPASALLERIRAARKTESRKPKAELRSATPLEKGPPRKGRKPSMPEGSKPPAFMQGFPLEGSSQDSRQVRLVRLKIYDDFNSLKAAEFPLRSSEEESERLSPLCLVGLNGSGKSNLIEVLSEIFCHAELSLLPWQSITDKQRRIDLRFELDNGKTGEGEPPPRGVQDI
jgi:type I restriction enzyme S subunit